jgi:hypothetical protein
VCLFQHTPNHGVSYSHIFFHNNKVYEVLCES